MSGLHRVADLLRQAVAEIESSSGTAVSENQTSSSSTELRRIFAPYRRWQRPSLPGTHGVNIVPKTTWTHKFCCLDNVLQETVPDKSHKKLLIDAGLGEKRIQLTKNKDPEYFRSEVISNYPKLKDGGGFELMRSNSRVHLEKITVPSSGYTSHYLADESGLGSAICYIRPIQQSLSLDPFIEVVPDENCIKEKCKSCGEEIAVVSLKDHIIVCGESCADGSDRCELEPPLKKTRRDRPICEFTCVTTNQAGMSITQESRESRCPICLETFPETVIHQHAAECGEEKGSNLKEKQTAAKSLEEDMELILQKIEKRKDVWTVHIVRRRFMQTASEELNDASEDDWEKPFRINFIGEEGLDSGGLRREFFTLLFKQTTIFEGCSFCLDSNLLAQKQYKLIGKATAIAIINGHPGPCRFNKFIAEYIVTGKEPDAREISKDDIDRADVVNLLNELESPQDLASVPDRFSELLQASGFRKILTEHNKEEALAAVKCHFVFYEKLGPLLQFMEGLRLHGVLQALQRHFEEGLRVFTVCKYPSAAEIAQFFIPRYSREEEKKAMEEIAVYNFNKFLKMVERGSVSTMAGDLENDDMQMKTLTTADVVRAFLGSDSLPRSVTSGMIEFNHSKNLSTINTCVPSLTLSNVVMLQSYETFESHMIYVIVGAPDFGIA